MALKVNEITTIEVEASDGQLLEEGDIIMLRVSRRAPEDVACRFAGLANGYFVTTTLDGQHENKYRQGSIETCYRIQPVEKMPPQASTEAGEGAAQEAAAPLLAAATE